VTGSKVVDKKEDRDSDGDGDGDDNDNDVRSVMPCVMNGLHEVGEV